MADESGRRIPAWVWILIIFVIVAGVVLLLWAFGVFDGTDNGPTLQEKYPAYQTKVFTTEEYEQIKKDFPYVVLNQKEDHGIEVANRDGITHAEHHPKEYSKCIIRSDKKTIDNTSLTDVERTEDKITIVYVNAFAQDANIYYNERAGQNEGEFLYDVTTINNGNLLVMFYE